MPFPNAHSVGSLLVAMHPHNRLIPLIVLSAGLAFSGVVLAVNTGEAPPLQDAVRSVEAETGGRVLRADTVDQGDHQVHRMKVLTPEGRVRVMRRNSDNDSADRPRSFERSRAVRMSPPPPPSRAAEPPTSDH